MLGIVLVALAVYLWWAAPCASRPAGKAARRWLPRWVLPRKQPDLQAAELRESARVVRELASLLRSGQNLDTALEHLVLIERNAGSALQALTSLRLRRGATWMVEQDPAGATDRHQRWLLTRLEWCVQISAESGAPLAQVLDHLADDLEATLETRRTFDVAMAGPRATTRLLTWLPVLGLLGAALFGIDILPTFSTTPVGQVALVLGVLLWLANRWWCRWLLDRCTRKAVG